MLARRVAVEHANDGLGEAREGLHVVERERRAKRRHGVGEAGLVHGDDVHVALAHDGIALGGDALLGVVEGEEVLRLVEHARLARVQVLGLGIAHDAAAKADAAALLVVDGEHDAVEELVAQTPPAVAREVGRDELVAREAALLELTAQRHRRVRVAEAPAGADARAEPARGEVATRLVGPGAAPAHEAQREGLLGRLERVDDAGALGPAPLGGPALVDVDVGALGEEAHGVEEVEPLALHNVVEDVAAGMAAEAVPEACRRRDVKARILLVVEGAAAPKVVAATRAQHHRLAHERHDVGRLADALLVLVADHGYASRETDAAPCAAASGAAASPSETSPAPR